MKVKITATITYEAELEPALYENVAEPPKTDDEIIAWEMEQAKNNTDPDADTTLVDALLLNGEVSDFKIEKVQDAQQEAA